MSRCPSCATPGSKVRRITPKALLTSRALRRLENRDYFFCAAADCDVVYFDSDGRSVFRKPDLTVRVGIKESEDPIPVCYCFGFLESDVRDDLVRHGRSGISDEIAREVGAHRCACEVRNPSGNCCLGEVGRAGRRLRAAKLSPPCAAP